MKEVIQERKIEKLFSVDKKVILVVGAGGIGECIARAYASNGALVSITNTSLEKSLKIKKNFEEEGLNCDAYEMDVTDKESIERVINEIVKKHGCLDVMLNTSAIFAHCDPEKYSAEKIRQILDINLAGSIFVAQEAAKVMIGQKHGKIINVGSIAGFMTHTYKSMPYEASKAGLHQFTKSAACSWAKYNIEVNCISPGWIVTPMNDGLPEETMDRLHQLHPQGRMAYPEDTVGAAIFLASDASNFFTGQVMYVDGGWTAGNPVVL